MFPFSYPWSCILKLKKGSGKATIHVPVNEFKSVAGFVRVLESPGKRPLVLESSRKLLNSTKKY